MAADPFAVCRERFARAPEDYDSAFCFFLAAQEGKRWDEAARHLDGLIARHPENYWLVLARGHIELTRNPEAAEGHYRAAAEGFARQRHAAGELAARHNLRIFLHRKGRLAEAEREVARALEVGEGSGDPLLLAQALALEALHLTEAETRDLGRAYRSLRRAEAAAFPAGSYRLRRTILIGLGNTCFEMGRLEEALAYYRRLEALTREAGDRLNQATAQYNLANTLLRDLEEMPRPEGVEEVRRLAEAALLSARASSNPDMEVMAHRTLGEVLGRSPEKRARARGHLEQCLAVARAIRQPREISHCLWSLANHLAGEDPRRADSLADEALRVALDSDHRLSIAFAWRQRMRLSWTTRPRERALADSMQALSAIEALREGQPEEASGARLFSAWTRDYYWLSGRLLRAARDEGAGDLLDRAYLVTERLRARTLLDALAAVRAAPAGTEADRARHTAAQDRLVRLQRQLLLPTLAPAARAAALAELDRAEDEEAEARRALEPAAARHGGRFPTLAEIRERLTEDEALLSYQIALWKDLYDDFGGGAWLLTVTRNETRLWPVADRVTLETATPVFLGLFERRDGSEAGAAARVHDAILGEALASLPPAVTRLIVVPDGPLHRLPLAALRHGAEAPPLAARFDLTIVPSATLWWRWRGAGPPLASGAVLALADPDLAGPRARPADTRASSLAANVLLGRLPYARREGRAAVAHLGGRVLLREEATERFVKTADLARYGVLHFAAHAVVDEEEPHRSAVLLAPGDEHEDGLLQAREIADLRLRGQLVVLSACHSASGELLRGEGVLGLARAFFEAGARAVVGSLWPLRDDEAAALFDDFYRHLGQGLSVSSALRAAQEDAVGRGAPGAAWAGLVVLGDGALVLPSARPASSWASPIALFGILALLVVVAGSLAARLKRRPHPA